ncbi:MAG TPA: right-handed parallel beta-helix repeat-containing protein, partial [candidate division Zixibacteria bacterium]|nr:right-handed parallel beta-helix repeat-containing protein [candidate division Zixibacteria bacterium]
MRKLTPLITSAALLLSSSLFAATIRVPQDQPNIQWGINAASNGDTVLVDRGAYAVNVNFNGKKIVLKSAWGSDSTILSPTVNGIPIISIVTGEDISTTVEGFRFLRGHAANGGAILFNNSSGRVLNSVFDACRAPNGAGGSIACFGNSSRVQVFNSIFKNGLGGVWNGLADALYSSGATVDFSRNLVINNSSNAVIYATANSHVKIINNTIAQTSNSSVALSVVDGSVGDLRNNIFFDNPAGSLLDNDLVTVEYNDFYLSPAGPFFGPGNISKDPLFEGGAPFSYRLQPSSPCIDVGDPKTAVPPLGGTRVDMGVFEFPGGIPIVGPDPRDSIIVESKTIAADSGTGGIVRLRVWITNKDTLA